MKDYGFEWDDVKAQINLRKHGVSFAEASTVFSEWGAPIGGDAEHSIAEDRFIIIGTSERQRLLIVAFTYREELVRIISAARIAGNSKSMSKKNETVEEDDPLDREIDFSNARPNPYARNYGRNRNLRILAPDLLQVFPDSESVNEALHTLVRVAAASVATPLKRSAKTATAPKPKKKVRA